MRCFDIGGSKIVVADVSESGVIVERARLPTITDNFNRFTHSIAEWCPPNSEPISLSLAAVIHPQTGVATSANIPCLTGRKLAAELSEQLQRPVHIINDADAFALAEASLGQAKSHSVVFAIILGTGVGGGIVIDGHVLDGYQGTTGEWGHGPAATVRTGAAIPVLPCQCGQTGCIDTLGGARGLEVLHRHVSGVNLDSLSILQAWLAHDKHALQTVDIWLDIVGGALGSVINVLGPSIVPVGGGLANCVPLIEALDHEVCQRCLGDIQRGLLYPTPAGPEQGLIGAALHGQHS